MTGNLIEHRAAVRTRHHHLAVDQEACRLKGKRRSDDARKAIRPAAANPIPSTRAVRMKRMQ
jgi:hypothetical protein